MSQQYSGIRFVQHPFESFFFLMSLTFENFNFKISAFLPLFCLSVVMSLGFGSLKGWWNDRKTLQEWVMGSKLGGIQLSSLI